MVAASPSFDRCRQPCNLLPSQALRTHLHLGASQSARPPRQRLAAPRTRPFCRGGTSCVSLGRSHTGDSSLWTGCFPSSRSRRPSLRGAARNPPPRVGWPTRDATACVFKGQYGLFVMMEYRSRPSERKIITAAMSDDHRAIAAMSSTLTPRRAIPSPHKRELTDTALNHTQVDHRNPRQAQPALSRGQRPSAWPAATPTTPPPPTMHRSPPHVVRATSRQRSLTAPQRRRPSARRRRA